jgi:integrase
MSTRKSTKKPLTALRIKNMKVGETLADIEENEGLRITRTKKDWRWWYRYTHPETGKSKQLVISYLSSRSLAEVRVIFSDLKAQRRAGNIPELPEALKPKKSKEEVIQVQDEPTISTIVNYYLKEHVYRNRQLKGAKETDRVLTNHVTNIIGNVPASDLTRKQVISLITAQTKKGHSAQGGVVLRELIAATEFAIGHTLLPDDFTNVALLAQRSLKQAKIKLTAARRQRYLSDDEIRSFLTWLPGSGFSQNHRFAMTFTLESGCRSGEAIAAKWEHLDLGKGIWTIPETKTDVPRQVKLPKQTLIWLRAAEMVAGNSGFLCPSPKGGHVQQKSISETAWHIRRRGDMLDIPSWTAHDLRRTTRTGLARLGCPQPVAEAILGHTKGGIIGIYDLHKYFDEGGEWLQKWNDHLDALRPDRPSYLKVVV